MRNDQHVLVIDDDPAICRLLKAHLGKLGVMVSCAYSGEDAQRALAESADTIDLILLDVMLPDIDGFALCRSLRKRSELAETPIIFLTGRDSAEDKIHAFDSGGTDYIVKPFNEAVLRARVGAALRTQRLLHERKEAAERIRHQRELLHCVIEHIPIAVFWKDIDLRYLGCNRRYAAQLGLHDPAEVIGRRDDELRGAMREAAMMRCIDEQVIAAGEPLLSVERELTGPCGRTFRMVTDTVPLRDAENRVIGVLGIHADITERKQAEDALRASEAQLHAITAQLPAVVWTTDSRLNISSIHGAILHEFKLNAAMMVGRPLETMVEQLTDRNGMSIVNAHRAAMLGESVQHRFTHDKHEFELRVEPLLGNDGECTGCLGLAFDITERNRIEEAEHSRAALQEAVRAMEQVIGVIAHELRTPLTGMRVMAEYLLSDGDVADSQSHFLNLIHDEVIRLAAMVNNLLEAARINSGKAKWNWSTFDLEEVGRDAVEIVKRSSTKDTLTIGCEIVRSPHEGNQPLMMQGDRDAVQRLFINLLANAEKHTDEGFVRLKISESFRPADRSAVERLSSENEVYGLQFMARSSANHEPSAVNREPITAPIRWIEIEVLDTGEGIPPHILGKLGTPFALNAGMIDDGQPDGVSRGHGTGLGLAICKGIVLAHGGRIQFSSSPGRGASVSVRMRSDLPEPSSADQPALFVNEVCP